MTRFASRIARVVAHFALALAFASTLTSCGRGGVSGPVPVNDPTRITVLPASTPTTGITAYSGLPTTLTISGGTGSYIVSSNNQAIIQVSGPITGSTVTFIPNPVLADTTVTITVRDTGTTPTVDSTVTVKPGTVANDISIVPSSTQAAGCAPALCSGGDALVTATISQGGIPLPARGVSFSVVSGDFRFITSAPNASVETLDTQITVTTDETGKANARIRALAGVQNQTALLQVTDLGTGAYRRATFVIAQSTGPSPGFFISPDAVTFQGPRTDQCASSTTSAQFFIFGGSPPYAVSSSSASAFFISQNTVSSSGGSFIITPTGICVPDPGLPITILDAAGHTVTAIVKNIPGTQSVPDLVVGPSSVTLTSCASNASVTAAGGTGVYTWSTSTDAVDVSQANAIFTIHRRFGSTTTSGTATISISDGNSVVNVTVNLTGGALGTCGGLTLTPSTVNLTCNGTSTITISGGPGPYTAASNNSTLVTAPANPIPFGTTTFVVARLNSGTFTPPGIVTVSDSSNPVRQGSVTVTAPATCP